MRRHHSLRLTRRPETPERCSAVLLTLDMGVCGAGGREPAPSPLAPSPGMRPCPRLCPRPRPQVSQAAAPSLPGSCLHGSCCLCLRRHCARLPSPRSPRAPWALWLSEGMDEWSG